MKKAGGKVKAGAKGAKLKVLRPFSLFFLRFLSSFPHPLSDEWIEHSAMLDIAPLAHRALFIVDFWQHRPRRSVSRVQCHLVGFPWRWGRGGREGGGKGDPDLMCCLAPLHSWIADSPCCKSSGLQRLSISRYARAH